MPFTTAGVYYPGGSQAPNVPADMAALASSINTKVVGVFADTAARDAAFTGLTSSQKIGIQAWITNRQGFSYWDPTSSKWQWLGQNRILASIDQGGGVDLKNPTDSYTVIMDPPLVNLPPGNRLVSIEVSGVATSISTAGSYLMAAPRLSVAGSGMGAAGASNTLVQDYIPAGIQNAFVTLSRTWKVVVSGAFDIVVYALNSDGGGYCRFNGGHLDVIDLGPTDG